MFGLGMPEILLILAIALIVIGPKKLPELAKTLGRAMGEFKRSAQDFKRSIDVDTTVTDVKDITTPQNDTLKKAVADAKKEADENTADQDQPDVSDPFSKTEDDTEEPAEKSSADSHADTPSDTGKPESDKAAD